MRINIKRQDDDFAMEASNDTGNTVMMDGSESIGGHNKGMRPMQLLLTALGGCSAIDVISILKKQRQRIDSFDVEVDADSVKEEEHSVWKNVIVHFKINGEVDLEKAEKAAKLSIDKYCSVSKAMEYSSNIKFRVTVNGVEKEA